MKKLIVVIALIICAGFNGQGQGVGTFEFMNVGVSDDRQIYDALTGAKAAGTAYKIAVFWGPAGTTDESGMLQVGTASTFLTSPGEGQFNGGARTIFQLSEDGAVVAFQARAWDVSTGETWELAAADPAGRIGKGPIFDMKTKDPGDLMEQLPRLGYAPGWQGFAIAVPEPSTWAFAAVGAGLLLLRRRRR